MDTVTEHRPVVQGETQRVGPMARLAPSASLPCGPALSQAKGPSFPPAEGAPHAACGTHPRDVEHRDVEPDEVAARLRTMLGLAPERPVPGEQAASFHRALPSLVTGLDAGAWIAWCMVGLALFSGGFPSLAMVRHETKRALLALVMLRTDGNVSSAGRITGTSRKVLRDGLKQVGLYPWRGGTVAQVDQ
jgi:hypothetical protein